MVEDPRSAEHPARGRAWTDRQGSAALAVVASVLGLPYAISGPGFIIDDFYTLREAALEGWYMAAGSEQWAARPGAGVVYALVFGAIGDRPMAVFALQTTLVALTSVLLFLLLRLWISRGLAFAVAMTWLVLPNHSAIDVWASVQNGLVSVLLVFAGFLLLGRQQRSTRLDLAACVFFPAAILSYEAVGPVAAFGVALVAVCCRQGRDRWLLLTVGLGAQLIAGLWMVTHWHPEKREIDVWISPTAVMEGHFTHGLFGDSAVGSIAGLVVVLLLAAVIGRRLLRSSFADERSARLFIGGLAVLVVGTLPFVRYFYAPLGFGDRATLVSGFGGAAILVGLALELRAMAPRLATAGVLVAAVLALPWRVELATTYSTAAADGCALLTEVERRFPEPPEKAIVIGPYPVLRHNVGAALQFDWMIQWKYRDRSVEVITTYNTADFLDAGDARHRFDLLELSELEPDIDPDPK